jgi:hypothetical protein
VTASNSLCNSFAVLRPLRRTNATHSLGGDDAVPMRLRASAVFAAQDGHHTVLRDKTFLKIRIDGNLKTYVGAAGSCRFCFAKLSMSRTASTIEAEENYRALL